MQRREISVSLQPFNSIFINLMMWRSNKGHTWLQQELSKKWPSALVGLTQQPVIAPNNGAHLESPTRLLSVRETSPSLNALPPQSHQPIENRTKEGRKKLHRKSPVPPPVTGGPVTPSRFCYQRTLSVGKAHSLGTTGQCRERCVFPEGSCPRTRELVSWEGKHAPNCPRTPAPGPAARPGKEARRRDRAH